MTGQNRAGDHSQRGKSGEIRNICCYWFARQGFALLLENAEGEMSTIRGDIYIQHIIQNQPPER